MTVARPNHGNRLANHSTSVVFKTMEHILYKAIFIYLEKYNILTDCQRGFRQGRSYGT